MSYETRQEGARAVQDSVRTYTAAAAKTALRLCARHNRCEGNVPPTVEGLSEMLRN